MEDTHKELGTFFQWLRKRKTGSLIGDFIGGVILSLIMPISQQTVDSTNSISAGSWIIFIIFGGLFGGLIKAGMTYDNQKKKLKKEREKLEGKPKASNEVSIKRILIAIPIVTAILFLLIVIFSTE